MPSGNFAATTSTGTTRARPAVNRISLDDLRHSLRQGYADFLENPSHLVFLGLIYPVVGLIFARMMAGGGELPLIYPLIAGFALIGPFAAIGLYDFSRQRELGRAVSWRDAFDVLRSPRIGSILAVGVGLAVLFVIWLRAAQGVYDITLAGQHPDTIAGFLSAALFTAPGWGMIVLGTAVGFVFAAVALAIGAVSFPLLIDRDLGGPMEEQTVTAVWTSVRAVAANPVVMAAWGLVVVAGLAIGAITLLVGMAVVMPVLGHATWHLYRRLIAR